MSEWACKQCTFLNHASSQECEICTYKRFSQSIQHTRHQKIQQQYQHQNNQQQYIYHPPERVFHGQLQYTEQKLNMVDEKGDTDNEIDDGYENVKKHKLFA
eukprot:539731_1